jgi:hypothetical protein
MLLRGITSPDRAVAAAGWPGYSLPATIRTVTGILLELGFGSGLAIRGKKILGSTEAERKKRQGALN